MSLILDIFNGFCIKLKVIHELSHIHWIFYFNFVIHMFVMSSGIGSVKEQAQSLTEEHEVQLYGIRIYSVLIHQRELCSLTIGYYFV